MSESLKVLIVEDSEDDALLLLRILREQGFDPIYERVETEKGLERALEDSVWDVIISDYVLPSFGGLDALHVVQREGLDIPFIMVSGTVGEEIAVGSMKAGAHDYLMKGNMTRLGEAIRREIKEKEVREEREQSREDLIKAQEEWQRTFDAIRDLVFVQDKDFTIVRANKAFAEAVKMKKKDIEGRKCYEILHGRKSPWPNCPFAQTRVDKKTHTEEVDDPYLGLPLLVTTSPVFDSEGNFAGSVHVSKDMSEIKKMTDEQEKHIQELEVFYQASMGRENRILELKEEIVDLKEKLEGVLLKGKEESER